MIDEKSASIGEVRLPRPHHGEYGFVRDTLRHMRVDRICEIHSLEHRVAVLQLAALAIGEFDDDAVPIDLFYAGDRRVDHPARSEEHTSELQSLMRISYAVFCLQKKTHINNHQPLQSIHKHT